MPIDPVTLTQELIRFKTVNPPGDKATCAAHLAALLERSGFTVEDHAFGPRRTSLVARFPGRDPALAPLVLTGHLDTVPLGVQPWSVHPFNAEIRDGRLYGRGASDMKAGVAAAMSAAVGAADDGRLRRGVTLVLTAGEETGCEGARHLAGTNGALGEASGLIVAEPTSNGLVVAHKGALHLRARTTGKTAHGSMPQLGDNAVMKAVRAIAAVEAHRFEEHPHPLLGAPTLAVTSVHGGENVNSVPDACAFTLDIRTIPGMDHAGVLTRLRACLEPDATLDPPLADLGAVGTDPDHPFVRCVQEIVARHAGKRAATPAGMPYFTDGSILQPAYQQCPTVVIGPGEPGQAHQMDEFCAVGSIVRAAAIYRDVIEAWCEA